jgi:hypothetical protein
MQFLRSITGIAAVSAAVLALVSSCGTQRKIGQVRAKALSPLLSMTEDRDLPAFSVDDFHRPDTMVVEDPDGNKVLIMRAVKDENGEMVATDEIRPSIIVSRFRNVAERHGKVDLRFRITVPPEMQDSDWQLRIVPELSVLDEKKRLDPVLITGSSYRQAQLKGYERYQRFIDSIETDTTVFLNRFQLEVFLKRNIPELYRFRTDSTEVSDEAFASVFGVTERQAIDHYIDRIRLERNRRKIGKKAEMFERYVRVPLVSEGIRLDTVIRGTGGEMVYDYVQTIATRPRLKKAEINLCGGIYRQDSKIYDLPSGEPISFYISSVGGLVDDTEHYLTRIIERKASLETACYVDFKSGSAVILPELGRNSEEIARIKSNFVSIMENRVFDLDSVVVRASCSPEGAYDRNRALSLRRSEAVSSYFNRFMHHWADSVEAGLGYRMNLDERWLAGRTEPVRFVSRSDPENWTALDLLVDRDTLLSRAEKAAYRRLASVPDPDTRENRLQELGCYRYLREHLYPRLRTVRFDFYLHRKGMVKDTVHTTVLDSVYMAGVQAIRDTDYEKALTLLRPYRDFNCAVAYCALDYNASAIRILESLERSARSDYLLAILYSRTGDDRNAVQHYLSACAGDRGFVHRGNLDPEISSLVTRYGLRKEIDRNLDPSN